MPRQLSADSDATDPLDFTFEVQHETLKFQKPPTNNQILELFFDQNIDNQLIYNLVVDFYTRLDNSPFLNQNADGNILNLKNGNRLKIIDFSTFAATSSTIHGTEISIEFCMSQVDLNLRAVTIDYFRSL